MATQVYLLTHFSLFLMHFGLFFFLNHATENEITHGWFTVGPFPYSYFESPGPFCVVSLAAGLLVRLLLDLDWWQSFFSAVNWMAQEPETSAGAMGHVALCWALWECKAEHGLSSLVADQHSRDKAHPQRDSMEQQLNKGLLVTLPGN